MSYINKQDQYKNQIFRWRKVKEKAVTYMGGKCTLCNFTGHPAAFHFHHTNPEEKDCNWNKLRLRSWSRILLELEKCQLLCANCHAVQHTQSKYD